MLNMKSLTILILSSLLTITLASQNKRINAKDYDNLIKIDSNLYIDAHQTSIIEYSHFLGQFIGTDSIEYFLPKPNMLAYSSGNAWLNDIYQYSDTNLSFMIRYWFVPIFNVTKEDAIRYCKYRTKEREIWHQNLSEKKKKKYPSKVIYRLPTEKEWIQAASGGLNSIDYPYGCKNIQNESIISKQYGTYSEKDDGWMIMLPTGSSSVWKFGYNNEFGIYNMSGDVAEYVLDSDSVMGGSYIHPLNECKVFSKDYSFNPEPWIGFRCIAEIIEN